MTGKELMKIPRALFEHATGKLKWYLDCRTSRQRIFIVLLMLLGLICLECCVAFGSKGRIGTWGEIKQVEILKP